MRERVGEGMSVAAGTGAVTERARWGARGAVIVSSWRSLSPSCHGISELSSGSVSACILEGLADFSESMGVEGG